MTQINLPNKSVTGTNFWSQVEDNDQAIADVVNGDLDASNLADGAVTTAKIGDSQVTTAKIEDGAVTQAKLAASTTANATMRSGASSQIVARKFADGMVTLSGSALLGSWPGYFDSVQYAGSSWLMLYLGNIPVGYRPGGGAVGAGAARFSDTLMTGTVVLIEPGGNLYARASGSSTTAYPFWFVDGFSYFATV